MAKAPVGGQPMLRNIWQRLESAANFHAEQGNFQEYDLLTERANRIAKHIDWSQDEHV